MVLIKMERPVKVEDLQELWVEHQKLKQRVTMLETAIHEIRCNTPSKDINEVF